MPTATDDTWLCRPAISYASRALRRSQNLSAPSKCPDTIVEPSRVSAREWHVLWHMIVRMQNPRSRPHTCQGVG